MDFADRWTVRRPAEQLSAALRRAAEFLDSLGPVDVAVSGLTLDREADDVVLTVAFDHWQLPADLDYLDPRMAAGYHHDEGQRDDIDFMVALARTRSGADVVEWVWGSVGSLDTRDADLVVMTGNIPSIYVTDEGWESVLGAIHRALRPGGCVAFLSWNPDVRPWEQWNGILVDADEHRVRSDDAGPPMVVSDDGLETLVCGSEWRYRTHEELTRSLLHAGFVVEQAYGDWHRSPLTPASPDIVLVARRT